jgi:3-hydroxyisobutyrate dehydrogenase
MAIRMGDNGAGQATKAVNQIMVAGINQAVTEALAFGQASGLNMDDVIALISQGAAGNWFLEQRGPNMTKDIFTPGFKMVLHNKDLNICKNMAADLGVSLPVIDNTLNDYAALLEQGHGDDDISTLYRTKKAMFQK